MKCEVWNISKDSRRLESSGEQEWIVNKYQTPSKRRTDGDCPSVRPSIRPSLRLKTHGVENLRRFSESKIGTDFRNVCHAKTTPIFHSENRRRFSTLIRTCSIWRSIFGSTLSISTVVIGLSSLFSFGLFVNSAESVNKHFDYIFSYFCYDLQLYECIIAAATASSSLFSAMSVFGVENRRRFLRSKIGAGFRPRVSSALHGVWH